MKIFSSFITLASASIPNAEERLEEITARANELSAFAKSYENAYRKNRVEKWASKLIDNLNTIDTSACPINEEEEIVLDEIGTIEDFCDGASKIPSAMESYVRTFGCKEGFSKRRFSEWLKRRSPTLEKVARQACRCDDVTTVEPTTSIATTQDATTSIWTTFESTTYEPTTYGPTTPVGTTEGYTTTATPTTTIPPCYDACRGLASCVSIINGCEPGFSPVRNTILATVPASVSYIVSADVFCDHSAPTAPEWTNILRLGAGDNYGSPGNRFFGLWRVANSHDVHIAINHPNLDAHQETKNVACEGWNTFNLQVYEAGSGFVEYWVTFDRFTIMSGRYLQSGSKTTGDLTAYVSDNFYPAASAYKVRNYWYEPL